MEITTEQYDELLNDVKSLKLMVQELEDVTKDSISSVNILSDAIETDNVQDDAITTNKIVAKAIDASKIAIGTITSNLIEEGTIAADRLKVGDITALQISTGSITAGLLKTGGQAFSHNMTFSSTDADTVSWTAGTLKTADGTSYAIDAGNTGNMATRTYIYLDKSVSETVLQISTSYDAPLGDNRIPIATAKNGTNNAIFQVFAGGGGVFISGGMIEAHTIGATQIIAGTITGTEISGTTLSGIFVDAGTLTAGILDGVELKIGGTGSDQEIYFKDSTIYHYDFGAGAGTGAKGIAWKYSTTRFSYLAHHPGTPYVKFQLNNSGSTDCTLFYDAGEEFYIKKTDSAGYYAKLFLYSDSTIDVLAEKNAAFWMLNTGLLDFPDQPTAPLPATSGLCYKSVSPYQFLFYNGSGWEYFLDGSGW